MVPTLRLFALAAILSTSPVLAGTIEYNLRSQNSTPGASAEVFGSEQVQARANYVYDLDNGFGAASVSMVTGPTPRIDLRSSGSGAIPVSYQEYGDAIVRYQVYTNVKYATSIPVFFTGKFALSNNFSGVPSGLAEQPGGIRKIEATSDFYLTDIVSGAAVIVRGKAEATSHLPNNFIQLEHYVPGNASLIYKNDFCISDNCLGLGSVVRAVPRENIDKFSETFRGRMMLTSHTNGANAIEVLMRSGYAFESDGWNGSYDISSFTDPTFEIDPEFAALNPGISLFVDKGFGLGPEVGGVPEPASWALMIIGFGLVGAMERRNRPVRSVNNFS